VDIDTLLSDESNEPVVYKRAAEIVYASINHEVSLETMPSVRMGTRLVEDLGLGSLDLQLVYIQIEDRIKLLTNRDVEYTDEELHDKQTFGALVRLAHQTLCAV